MSVEQTMLHSRSSSTMKNLGSLVFLTLFHNSIFVPSTIGDSEFSCRDLNSKSASNRLHQLITCILDARGETPPTENLTDVDVFVTTNVFNFNEEDNNLEFDGIFYISWVDENFVWNRTFYDDLRTTKIQSTYMWSPHIVFPSPGNDNNDDYGAGGIKCILHYQGEIQCLDEIRRKIRCETDYTQWPYDRPKCTLTMTSWSHSLDEMKLHLAYARMHGSNGEWSYWITRTSQDSGESFYYSDVGSSRIEIDFTLERSRTHVRGRYVAPAIIMMVMTLTALWLDPKSIGRLGISCLNIIVHMLCIQDVHWALPHTGTTVPNLIIFYCQSFVLATVTLVLTFFMRKMKDAKATTPDWIASRIVSLVKTKVGRILLLIMFDAEVTAGIHTADDDDDDDSSRFRSKEATWMYFVIVFSWILFFVFFVTYVVMFAVLILTSTMNTPVEALETYD